MAEYDSRTIERFWKYVIKRGTDECWDWTGSKDHGGYGQIGVGGRDGRNVRSHRFAWILVHGPIQKGLCVCHRCDRPSCVNERHLFLGSQQDNLADSLRKGHVPSGERHWNAALPFDRILELKNRKGENQRLLSIEYGVSQASISRYINGATRRNG